MSRFLVLMAEEDHFARWDAAGQEQRARFFDALAAFTDAVRARGSIVAGEGLARPEAAVTLRPGAEPTSGPYAETVEQVGGFFLVDLPDMDAAVEVGRLLPTTVELRPIVDGVSLEPLERAVRDEWGRLLALLVAQYRRLDLAEDGLADAVEAAARTWGHDGAPANPAAWLLTAARRRVVDRLRAEAVAARRLPHLAVDAELTEEAQRTMALGAAATGEPADERLRLLLLCAHPSLRPEAAAALSLRMVMGVSTEDLARLFLVRTSTMAARLTRAKAALAGASFSMPVGAELAARVGVVADIAYLAFTAGYAPGSGPDVLRPHVAAEAIRLVRLLRSLLPPPTHPELDALLALMLLQHSRRDARVVGGRLVLLPDQDRSRWRHDEIAEAVALLTPLVHAAPAPYLLQALVAAEHAIAPRAADTDWARIVRRYDELLELRDSPVVRLNRAVAVGEADGPLAGLRAVEGLTEAELPGHRLPAARADLLVRAGRPEAARAAYDDAVARCGNEAERAHLEERRALLAVG